MPVYTPFDVYWNERSIFNLVWTTVTGHRLTLSFGSQTILLTLSLDAVSKFTLGHSDMLHILGEGSSKPYTINTAMYFL